VKTKTYYEILGIAPHVGSGQIQAAYRFARGLYSGEAAPSHGLLDAAQKTQMLQLVEEAYAALSNPNTRRHYDIHLNQAGTRPMLAAGGQAAPPASAAPPPAGTVTGASADEGISHPIRVPEVVNGAVLRTLRESRNLSIEQIAALSKVGSRFLKALEEDRHEAIPGRVFARGFLIEYARAIRASESEIVDRYLRHWRSK
jgi:curved DNA-binding protein CbpA